MKEKKTRAVEAPVSVYDQLLWRVAAATVVLILLFVSPSGMDVFRIPKDVIFRLGGLVLGVILVFAFTSRKAVDHRMTWRAPDLLVGAAIVVWTVIATLLSTNRYLSVRSLVTAALGLIIYVAVRRGSTVRPDNALKPLLWVSNVNAVVYLLQDFGIFNPFNFRTEYSGHNAASGLLGNANDIGSVLLFPALASVALAITSPENKWFYRASAALLFVTLLDSRAIAAIGAWFVGAAAIGVIVSWKKATAAIIALAVLAGIAVGLVTPLRARAVTVIAAAKSGNLDELLRGRAPSFMAAGRIFRAHPLTGAGPGTFGWHYMPEKLAIDREHPGLATSLASLYNFAEVHNDHLEVLAETGMPGYLLMLAAVVTVASVSVRLWRTSELSPRRRFARIFALPLAVSFAVLALAQYPLQLASATCVLLFLSAVCISWGEADARA